MVRHARTGDFLLVRRANAPMKGLWAFAGGRIEPGETAVEAAMRELLEETGIKIGAHLFMPLDEITFDQTTPAFHLTVFQCVSVDEPIARDDALAAGYFTLSQIEKMALTPDTERLVRAAAAIKQ